MKTTVLIPSLLVATGVAIASSALPSNALTLNTCTAAQLAAVTGASACQYLTPPDPSNVASTANINAAGFFGITNWVAAGKLDINGTNFVLSQETVSIGLTGSGNAQSGTWGFNPGTWSNYANVLIVYKDGGNTNLVGYQLTNGVSSGTWTTPFLNPPFDVKNPRDVSHFAAFVSGQPTGVPEPLTILGTVIALGFGGLFQKERSKRQQKTTAAA